MKGHAKTKWVGYPANKVRLVMKMIRGYEVEEAIKVLKFTDNIAARPIEKTIKSAVANLIDKNVEENVDTNELTISTMYADEGPTMKRFKPRAQGRATKIRKRTSHIFIEVSTK